MNETKHIYKGYEIIGTFYESEGTEIFHSGYYRESTIKRNYNIKKDGRYVINPYCIIEKLKYAKEMIEELIEKQTK